MFRQSYEFLRLEHRVTALVVHPEYDGYMLLGLELFFIGLLALASVAIAFVSGVVVYKLFKGQR